MLRWYCGILQAVKFKTGHRKSNLNYQFQINWARDFGKHAISAMGLASRQEVARGSEIPNYREDWVFRTTYNYADKYFFRIQRS